MTFILPQFFAIPVPPLLAAAPAGGMVLVWPSVLAICVWLVSAALVGTLLGMLREHTAGPSRRSVPEHGPNGHEAHLGLRTVRHAA